MKITEKNYKRELKVGQEYYYGIHNYSLSLIIPLGSIITILSKYKNDDGDQEINFTSNNTYTKQERPFRVYVHNLYGYVFKIQESKTLSEPPFGLRLNGLPTIGCKGQGLNAWRGFYLEPVEDNMLALKSFNGRRDETLSRHDILYTRHIEESNQILYDFPKMYWDFSYVTKYTHGNLNGKTFKIKPSCLHSKIRFLFKHLETVCSYYIMNDRLYCGYVSIPYSVSLVPPGAIEESLQMTVGDIYVNTIIKPDGIKKFAFANYIRKDINQDLLNLYPKIQLKKFTNILNNQASNSTKMLKGKILKASIVNALSLPYMENIIPYGEASIRVKFKPFRYTNEVTFPGLLLNIDLERKIIRQYSGCHPHVSLLRSYDDTKGKITCGSITNDFYHERDSICFGGIKTEIYKSLRQFNLYRLLFLLHEWYSSINEGDMYWNYRYFYTCKHCGGLVIKRKNEFGGRTLIYTYDKKNVCKQCKKRATIHLEKEIKNESI